jgi:hypothetical protein
MAISTRQGIFQNMTKGLGAKMQFAPLFPASTTTAATGGTSGSSVFNVQLGFNQQGTTLPGTLVGFQLPPGLSTNLFTLASMGGSTNTQSLWLVYLYKIGTLVLSSTGNQFTHDAATFPVTRTLMGQATQALNLVPVLYITTATTTTAAAFILKASGGTAGYTNQSAAGVVGTKTFTLPAAATAVNSAYILRLEEGDSAIQDMTQIDITIAASAGAATVFGMELIGNITAMRQYMCTIEDALFSGFFMKDLVPAAATSGSATSYLALASFSNGLSGGVNGDVTCLAVLNS